MNKIKINIKDKESLKNGILEFKALMNEAYKSKTILESIASFVTIEDKTFVCSDFINEEQIEDISEFDTFSFESYTKREESSQKDEDSTYSTLSHLVVFQNALEYEELEELIVEFCKEFVEHSKEVNGVQLYSEHDMFFASKSFFGIPILVLLVEKHHQYSYLIGDSVVLESGSDYVEYHVLEYIMYLFNKYKCDDLIINLLASCRFNLVALSSSLFDDDVYIPDLFKCFFEDKNKYEYYKRCLIESFKRSPMSLDDFELLEYIEEGYDRFYDNDESGEYDGIYFDDFILHGKSIKETKEILKNEILK